ncbi:MAG: hypothetical protein ABEN55_03965 [Bradymonadaceae bacterium]
MGANEEAKREIELVHYLEKHDDRDWEPLGQNPGVCAIESSDKWESRLCVEESPITGKYYARQGDKSTDDYEDPLDALEELDND